MDYLYWDAELRGVGAPPEHGEHERQDRVPPRHRDAEPGPGDLVAEHHRRLEDLVEQLARRDAAGVRRGAGGRAPPTSRARCRRGRAPIPAPIEHRERRRAPPARGAARRAAAARARSRPRAASAARCRAGRGRARRDTGSARRRSEQRRRAGRRAERPALQPGQRAGPRAGRGGGAVRSTFFRPLRDCRPSTTGPRLASRPNAAAASSTGARALPRRAPPMTRQAGAPRPRAPRRPRLRRGWRSRSAAVASAPGPGRGCYLLEASPPLTGGPGRGDRAPHRASSSPTPRGSGGACCAPRPAASTPRPSSCSSPARCRSPCAGAAFATGPFYCRTSGRPGSTWPIFDDLDARLRRQARARRCAHRGAGGRRSTCSASSGCSTPPPPPGAGPAAARTTRSSWRWPAGRLPDRGLGRRRRRRPRPGAGGLLRRAGPVARNVVRDRAREGLVGPPEADVFFAAGAPAEHEQAFARGLCRRPGSRPVRRWPVPGAERLASGGGRGRAAPARRGAGCRRAAPAPPWSGRCRRAPRPRRRPGSRPCSMPGSSRVGDAVVLAGAGDAVAALLRLRGGDRRSGERHRRRQNQVPKLHAALQCCPRA